MKSNVVDVTKEYYDSSDADNFYFHVWGGEDIHIGLYKNDSEPIADASVRTVEAMAERLKHLPAGARVLDVGAGYGGAGRYLARKHGLHVTCLNLSLAQNERNRQMNRRQGLADTVDVVVGDFEPLPFEADSFDAVWSQDAILHSGNRKRVFEEIDRVLKAGGDIVITDPMQKSGVDKKALRPVLDRIHLESMGSVADYKAFAADLGWSVQSVDLHNHQLVNHYSRVRAELRSRESDLREHCSAEYMDRMQKGLGHWIEAGKQGRLEWGILHFRKG